MDNQAKSYEKFVQYSIKCLENMVM